MKPITFLLFLLASLHIHALDGKKILDATSSKLEKCGDIEATFTLQTQSGSQQLGSFSGTLSLSGKKFHVHSQNELVWFDGNTMWDLDREVDEVTVTTPTKAEQQALNPYTFINLYKKGYTITASETTLGTKACYLIQLRAKNQKQDIQEMTVYISQHSSLPIKVSMRRQDNNWVHISLGSIISGKKYPASTFVFNPASYPDVDLVDLR